MAARSNAYWDSCVFLAIVNDEEGRADICSDLFRRASVERQLQIVTSALSLSECSVPSGTQEQSDKVREMFRDPAITLVNLDRLIAESARDLQRRARVELNKRLPVRDSVHLATAIHQNVTTLFTYDGDDLVPLSGVFKTLNGQPVIITEPLIQDPRLPGI